MRVLVSARQVERDALGRIVGHGAVDAHVLAREVGLGEERVQVAIVLDDGGQALFGTHHTDAGQFVHVDPLPLAEVAVWVGDVDQRCVVDDEEPVGVAAAHLEVAAGRHAPLAHAAAKGDVAHVGALAAHLHGARHELGGGVRLVGYDVDDARHGIGAVERARRAAHHLDAADVLDAHRQRLPHGGALAVAEHRSAVDHHQRVDVLGVEQHVVVGDVVEPAQMHVVDAVELLAHNHARNQPQSLLDGGAAVGAYLLAGQHRRRQRRLERVLLLLGGRRHVLVHYHLKQLVDALDFEQLDGIHKVFEGEVRQLFDRHRQNLLFGQTGVLRLRTHRRQQGAQHHDKCPFH